MCAMDASATSPAVGRSLAPDLGRGLMLAFIAPANVGFYVHDEPAHLRPAHGVVDRVVEFVSVVAIDARSFPMFAFLFGYGMVQFRSARRRRGVGESTIAAMLRRRHVAMVGIGVVHFLLLFAGDIVSVYGLAGLLVAWVFLRLEDRQLLLCVGVFLGLLFLAGVVSMVVALLPLGVAPPGTGDMLRGGAGVAAASVTEPHYLQAVAARIPMLVVVPVQVFATPILPMVLLGVWAGRQRFLEEPGQHRRLLRRVAVVGIALAWASALPMALFGAGVNDLAAVSLATSDLAMVLGVCGGVGYIALIALLADRWQDRPRRPVRWVAALGQRSLSGYLWQSVVLAPLLCAWGLGWGNHLRPWLAALLALAAWATSVAGSAWLARRGRRGPAERVLRRFTYGRPAQAMGTV